MNIYYLEFEINLEITTLLPSIERNSISLTMDILVNVIICYKAMKYYRILNDLYNIDFTNVS